MVTGGGRDRQICLYLVFFASDGVSTDLNCFIISDDSDNNVLSINLLDSLHVWVKYLLILIETIEF